MGVVSRLAKSISILTRSRDTSGHGVLLHLVVVFLLSTEYLAFVCLIIGLFIYHPMSLKTEVESVQSRFYQSTSQFALDFTTS